MQVISQSSSGPVQLDALSRPGIVYLVGAGPGDPGLITVRGLDCIRKAEVVVYDYLAGESLLEEAPASAERIYVGKRAGAHSMQQAEINSLLVSLAMSGRTTVRLKGGDPFVFGRGGEECLALREAGIQFEVVPGITAGIAVPAYAGIPVTHRPVSSTLTFVTGHEDPLKDHSEVDWGALGPGTGTLVFYMGMRNLPGIVEQLITHGRAPDTPVALIRWGTRPEQETLTGTLSDIVERSSALGFQPPVLIVVGQVVDLRERLNWYESKPLFAKRILITRSRDQASDLARRLSELGALPIECPTISIQPPSDWAPVDDAIGSLAGVDWVVFTSANGVDRFIGRLLATGHDIRRLGPVRLCAIGPATAGALGRYHLRADLLPAESTSASIAGAFAALGDQTGVCILLPRADIAPVDLPRALEKLGAEVRCVTAYRTVRPDGQDAAIASLVRGEIDVVTFTSSSTARNLIELLGSDVAVSCLNGTIVASIGPVTSETLRASDVRVDVEARADDISVPGLVRAIVSRFGGQGQCTTL